MDEWYAIMGAKARTKGRAGPETSTPGEGAEAALKDVFKGKRPDDIKKALASCGNDVARAADALLGGGEATEGKKAVAELWSDLAGPAKIKKGGKGKGRKSGGGARVQVQRAVDLESRLTGRATRPDDSTPSWQKGLFRPSSGAKAVGAGAPEAKGDALPFLRKAEKVIRDKIDHENQQAHNALERRRAKIARTFSQARERLREREEELLGEVQEAETQAAVHLFTGQKAALSLLDPTLHTALLGLAQVDRQSLLSALASGLNDLRLSHSSAEDLDLSAADIAFFDQEDLFARIGRFGQVGSSYEDEKVFGTLSAISKLLHPLEACSHKSQNAGGKARGRTRRKSASPTHGKAKASDAMSVSSESSNHSDQSVVMAEAGATASPKSSRAKRMQRWSTKVKEAVAEEFA